MFSPSCNPFVTLTEKDIWVDGILEDTYGEPLLKDAAGDNLDQVPHLDLLSLHATDDSDSVYIGLTIAGDVFADPWGSYLIYFDSTQDGQGADIDIGKRPITVADPYQPEFILELRTVERNETVSGSYFLYAWDESTWQAITLTGGAAVQNAHPSVIELQIPKALLGNPEFINLGVVSTGRGRIHTAGDVMGIDTSPIDWEEPVTLDTFVQYAGTL
jgi:hypothetical protein